MFDSHTGSVAGDQGAHHDEDAVQQADHPELEERQDNSCFNP